MEKCKQIVTHPITVLLSYIIAVIGLLLALSENLWLQIIATSVVCLCAVLFLIYAIKWNFNYKEEKKRLTEEFQKHYYANADKSIGKASNLIRDIINNSLNAQNIKISDEHFQSACKNICKSISDLLSALCGIEFNVCLKQICVDQLVANSYEDACTQVIARSGDRTGERSRNDHIRQRISENTSFLAIIQTNDRCWASPNLETTVSDLKRAGAEYRNPDARYEQYYNSTIVSPVRIDHRYVSNAILEYAHIEKPKGYHYIAFLCVDSPNTFSENDSRFKLASVTLAACGDALYPFFENKLVKEIKEV